MDSSRSSTMARGTTEVEAQTEKLSSEERNSGRLSRFDIMLGGSKLCSQLHQPKMGSQEPLVKQYPLRVSFASVSPSLLRARAESNLFKRRTK